MEMMGDVTHPNEDNICSLHRHVGTSTNGNANVSLRQCGWVVDAVPHHGDTASLSLQLSHLRHFLWRQHLGKHRPDAHLGGDQYNNFKLYLSQMGNSHGGHLY